MDNTSINKEDLNLPEIVAMIQLKKNPCLFAAFKNDLNSLKIYVQQGLSINIPNKHTYPYETCLSLASLNNNLEMVQYLIYLSKSRSCLYFPSPLFENPLCHAASHGNVDMVSALLDQENCNINIQLDKEWTPLFYAVIKQNLQVVQMLLEAGSKVNIYDSKCRTPIHYATEYSDPAGINILQLLLHFCDDVNSVDEVGQTPLFLAIINDNTDAVELLLKYGSFLTHNFEGLSPLLYAYNNGKTSLIKTILKYHKYKISNNDLIIKICSSDDVKSLKMICNIGSLTSKNMVNCNIWPLIEAIQCDGYYSNYSENIKLLLDHGIKLNQSVEEGMNPFFLAVRKRTCTLVKLLIDYGIDVHCCTYNEKIDMELYSFPYDVSELNTLLWSNGYKFVAHNHWAGIETLRRFCTNSQVDDSLELVLKLRKSPLNLLSIARNYVRTKLYNNNVHRGKMSMPEAVKCLNIPMNLKVYICDTGSRL